MSQNKLHFHSWEILFIRLCRYTFTHKEIAAYLNRSINAIQNIIKRNFRDATAIKIGGEYGRLTVLAFSHLSKDHSRIWKCQCGCANKTIVYLSSYALKNTTNSCGCLRLEKIRKTKIGDITGQFWGRFNRSTKQRKISIKITQQDIADLLQKQKNKCALSGMPIQIGDEGRTTETTASIDRINSNLCYEISNIQWVHKDVNYMKCDFEQDYFIEVCGMINKNFSFEYDDKTNDWW